MIRYTLTALCACVALTIAAPTLAQGTAAGPTTQHLADNANQAGYAGGVNDTVNGPGPNPRPWRCWL